MLPLSVSSHILVDTPQNLLSILDRTCLIGITENSMIILNFLESGWFCIKTGFLPNF